MTKEQKLAYHLEMVIWATLPDNTRCNAKEIQTLMNQASDDQKQQAYQRALNHNPRLLPDEL